MTAEERSFVLNQRRMLKLPLHSPPHPQEIPGQYLITAACYEHQRFFNEPATLSFLTEETLVPMNESGFKLGAWVFLPNHYHLLLYADDLKTLSQTIRKIHSRTATILNRKNNKTGKKIWFRYSDRKIRSENHLAVSINYIHYNPVKHGYVERVDQWPWSSFHDFVASQGNERVEQDIERYPLLDYGKGWDW